MISEADILQTFAEVGVALTGFTGIVVVVGGRPRRDWSPIELAQLHDLLWLSLVVVFFSFLPLVVSRALAPTTTWRVVSATFALMEIAFFSRYWWRAYGFFRSGTPMPAWGVRLQLIGVPAALAVFVAKGAVAFGFWLPSAPFVYLASLFLALAAASISFVYLLLPREQGAA